MLLTNSSATAAGRGNPPAVPNLPCPEKSLPRTGSGVSGLFQAATALAQLLGQGRALDSRALRSARWRAKPPHRMSSPARTGG
jgi:hypothetical protein